MDNDGDRDAEHVLNITASPLPPGWEQCLDLESGRIYYVNRDTNEKTWKDPRRRREGGEALGIDLNTEESEQGSRGRGRRGGRGTAGAGGREADMIATACAQCHMFVMISKVSLLCPNCKHVHSPLVARSGGGGSSHSDSTKHNSRA